MTQAELLLVDETLGNGDGSIGLAGLVAGHPQDLNAMWIDGEWATISVLRPDRSLLEVARCLERGAFVNRVQFVSVGIPLAELARLGDRISGDREVLPAGGSR